MSLGSCTSLGCIPIIVDDEYTDIAVFYWNSIPEPLLLNILFHLKPKDILNAGETCDRWYRISHDDFLWKKIFQRDFKIKKNIGLRPGASSWLSEYKRLTYNTPMVQTELLTDHGDQVLHVSFSHNGKMFATCSKDGYVIIWNSTYPAKVQYSHDMKRFSWRYTQYSQFNQTDTLLLVSGVHFGIPNSTSGEIAVFSVQGDSHLRCRVVNRPYDIFGTWFSDQYLISGDMHWLAHLISSSVLWLNKADQEISSETVPVTNQLYKFYNRNASSIRAITVANCPWLEDTDDINNESEITKKTESPNENINQQNSNEILSGADSFDTISNIPYRQIHNTNYVSSIHYTDDFHRQYKKFELTDDMSYEDDDDDDGEDFIDDDDSDVDDGEDDLDKSTPKYLIFSTGSKTYTPHQIGFKRIDKVNFPKKLEPGLSLKDRLALRKREKEQQNDEPETDWLNYNEVADRFDKIDKLIDLHGHIIGMGLSPDHRYLYVNSRPWPKNYLITNPLEPPPIAQEIDIHVIDLKSLKNVGVKLGAHKAYTPNTECFFIFLDVCDNYVASGAEDLHAYIWDRFYGICLAKFEHSDVVNSVAFNPRDSEMLVTTSDDHKIKIWRSKAKSKTLNAECIANAKKIIRK